jgi:hypothetical protein
MKINFLKKLLTNKKLCDMMYLQKRKGKRHET